MNVKEEKELDIPNCKTSTCKGTEIGYKVACTRTIKSLGSHKYGRVAGDKGRDTDHEEFSILRTVQSRA